MTPDSGPSVWLHDPVVMGDSVIGDAGRDNPPARRAYLVARIQRLQTGETSAGKTIGLVAIVALVAIAGLLVLAATSVEKIE